MPLRVGFLTTAHMHVHAYAHGFRVHPDSQIVGLWDDDVERGETFAQRTGIPFVGYLDDLLANVDAVTITSENMRHAELVEIAAKAGKHILCEKPLGPTKEHLDRIEKALADSGVKLMTAFPCRFSPAYQRLKSRVEGGEIGEIRAISATNRGRCPFGWFVEPEKSGGGAMIDHVVHVTDLLRDLLRKEPLRVQAQIGNNVYSECWEDTAMLTVEFPGDVFATIDSSWSRPQNFKTWGDVTMTVVGEKGVLELDMFGQALDVYGKSGYSSGGYGSDLDALMVDEFIRSCVEEREPMVTAKDGAQAARVALAGYKSVASGQPSEV
jgi:predicted dehydrogenase